MRYLIFFILAVLFFACNSTGSQAVKKPGKGSEPAVRAPVLFESFPADSVQEMLRGKWLRTDGAYTIEIFSVSEGGKLDAGYFNPGPINVGRSAWVIAEGKVLIDIELRDVNYPGSRYTLVFNNENRNLEGNYFQAVQGINYDVVFAKE